MTPQVLLTTDFSECSDAAARVAVDYARRLGARLHLLHVVWPTTDPTPQSRLDQLAKEIAGSVPVVTAVESGIPVAERIVKYAERQHIDLIVLGTHGRTGVSRALIGSVAERVVRTAPCPVLTVPFRARPTAPVAVGPSAAPPARCLVCGRSSEDLVCEPCRSRIRGEALEHKHREERAGRA
jgi:nucleotide-binding universal stress UspA family protein